MNVKKVLSAVLAAVLSVSSFAGCKQENGKIQVSVAGWPDKDLAPKGYEKYQNKKAEFETMYPDLEIVGMSWDYEPSTFMARAEGGELSTVYTSFMTEADKLISFGYAADITDYLKEYGYFGKINESLLNVISEGDSIYLLPKDAYALGLFINLKLFKEAGLVNADGSPKAPKTFEDLAEYAQIITEKTGKAGFVFPSSANQGGWNFTMLAWNFGAEFMKKDNGKWKAAFASDECAAALDYIKDLKWNKKVLPANTNIDAGEVLKLIGTDQAAMAIVHPAQLDLIVADYAMDTKDIAMVTIPAGPERHVTLMGGSYYVIDPKSTPEQIDGAFKWIQYNGLTTEMDDAAKARYEEDIKHSYDNATKIIGIKGLSVWNDTAETEQFKNEITEKYRNIPAENVADYNDNKDSIEYQSEEAVCAQELYAVLDSCIQEVLTNENSNSLEILTAAAADFQSDYLDYED